MNEIQNRLQAMISKLVALERERFTVEGGYSRDREIALLERRIAKLHEQIAKMDDKTKVRVKHFIVMFFLLPSVRTV